MKAFFIIIALVVFIISLLLFAHIRIKIYLSKEGKIVFKYLFFKYSFKFYSNNKKKSSANKKTGKKDNKKDDNFISNIIKEKGVFEGSKYLLSIIKKLFEHIFNIFKSGVIDNLNLKLHIADVDAATTAITYGAVCAVAYPIIGFINGWFKVNNQNVDIIACYDNSGFDFTFSALVKVRLLYVVKALVLFIFDASKLKNTSK